jgi:septal ring-binding cell division protein DamX
MRLHHATLLLVLLLAPLAACQSPQQRLEEAHRAYAVDDWSKAYAEADAAQRELQPPARQEAAYLAGMAAFRQDRLAEARVRFTVAEESTDRELSGKAKAMMGHLLEKQGDFAAAAGKYEEAAQRLTGDAAEKARAEAADARAKVTPAASVEVASAPSEDDEETVVQPRQTPAKPRAAPKKPAPKAPAKQAAKDTGKKSDAKPSGKGHTIQCGAYPQESQARKRAKDISDEAKRAGLPAPKVTRVTGRDGKRLWIVSVGSFPTREAAKKALAKLKVDHAEVLPALD